MLNRMRWRFIGAAMAAFAAVILILLLSVNLWNYVITIRQQDQTLAALLEFDQKEQPPFETEDGQLPEPFAHFSREMQFMTRFFSVRCNQEGQVISMDQEYIASISQEDAASYAQEILASGKTAGYFQDYRFLSAQTEDGTTIIFLNAERELQAMGTLLLVSTVVALVSLLAVFLLVVAFSRRAIAPYIRNLENQKRFITDASHELKTPLTAIATSADILAMEQGDSEWIQNIQSQSSRLSKLISNLVTLSRLDEAQPFPEQTDFLLSEALWEISEPMASLAEARGKTFSQQIPEAITLHGDRAAIQQMVSILLDNALKYSNDGGTIRLSVRRHSRKVEIQVYNTCNPMDPKGLSRLFDRFYRPDPSRSAQTGGTGIGLSIAKATAEAHGGKIRVDSRDGTDITFTVLL